MLGPLLQQPDNPNSEKNSQQLPLHTKAYLTIRVS